jgi:hypothetical protein
VESLIKCGKHVFQDEALDPVRAHGLMARGTSEGVLHYDRCNASQDHRNIGGRG